MTNLRVRKPNQKFYYVNSEHLESSGNLSFCIALKERIKLLPLMTSLDFMVSREMDLSKDAGSS